MEFKEDVSKWIVEWVSEFNADLNHVPCPFAKKALLDDQIDWKFFQTHQSLYNYMMYNLTLDKEVMIIGFDPKRITAEEASEIAETYNRNFMVKGLVALEDHPDKSEFVAGVNMNQGKWGWIAVQRLDKLNRASMQLSKTGYYEKWSDEEYGDVVAWRFEDQKSKFSTN